MNKIAKTNTKIASDYLYVSRDKLIVRWRNGIASKYLVHANGAVWGFNASIDSKSGLSSLAL